MSDWHRDPSNFLATDLFLEESVRRLGFRIEFERKRERDSLSVSLSLSLSELQDFARFFGRSFERSDRTTRSMRLCFEKIGEFFFSEGE